MNKKYISFLILMMGIAFLNSCLDQDPLFDPDKSNNIIEFYDLQGPVSPVSAPHRLYVNSYEISTAEDHSVMISYSGAHSNSKDIEVELAVSPQALAEYNQYLVNTGIAAGDTLANGDPDFSAIMQYELMPDNFYTGPLTVTIPKGETKALLTFSVNTTLFDFAKAYVLPLRIVGSSSGVISGNYGVALFNIGAKNAYHGSYHSIGLRTNYSSKSNWDGNCCPAGGTIASRGPWDFPDVPVLTVNEFTSTVHAANSDGGFGTINITVDPATNIVTVAPNASTALANLVPMTGKVSRYHPDASDPSVACQCNFELYYMYTNTNGTFRTNEHYLTLNE